MSGKVIGLVERKNIKKKQTCFNAMCIKEKVTSNPNYSFLLNMICNFCN